jgi:DNA (cytosine-5)-methyltransferase 1
MKIIDLYCGAGGLSLGFVQEGYEPVKAIDIDPVAVETYNRNVRKVAECKDILEVDPMELPDVDGIIGGPPCQSFSIAGRRFKIAEKQKIYIPRERVAQEDPRSFLSVRFSQIVGQKQPDWFVMENVDGLLNLTIRHQLEHIFKHYGYRMDVLILDAVKYGAPQFRKRLFFVGFRDVKKRALLLPSPLPPSEWRTVRDALPQYEYEWYYRHPRTYGRRAVYSVNEPSPTIRTVNRPMPKNYKRHPKDAPYIEGQVRALTSQERAILQTFPSNFTWTGTKTVNEKLIGDAVPVKLARVVARSLKDSL